MKKMEILNKFYSYIFESHGNRSGMTEFCFVFCKVLPWRMSIN